MFEVKRINVCLSCGPNTLIGFQTLLNVYEKTCVCRTRFNAFDERAGGDTANVYSNTPVAFQGAFSVRKSKLTKQMCIETQ